MLSFLGKFFNRQAVAFLQKVKQEGIADEGVLFDKVSIELVVNFNCRKFKYLLLYLEGPFTHNHKHEFDLNDLLSFWYNL